tara:strand:+ start:2331 stop:3371 length:1041 start_codon:yes stop_codon:yes gene_type:complete
MEEFLIERLQNFTLDRKVLSIDTNDRDKTRWPNPNEFEVSLPQTYSNVESIRLLNIQIPNKLYNISEHLQNNKMIVKNGSDKLLITLDDGYYSNSHICDTIQNKVRLGFGSAWTPNNVFNVDFNNVSQKPHFTSTNKDFSFIFFDPDISYNTSSNSPCNNNVYDQHSNWGLGHNLGFDNKQWVESHAVHDTSNSDIFFYYNSNQLVPTSAVGAIIPPKQIELNQNQFIYLEIDKYNTSDEIKPFINDRLNNTNTGLVNSYFAKIPIKYNTYNGNSINQSLTTKDDFIDSLSYYQPPIEKISKLKIKFRYHNGLPVDLGNFNISLTLEFNQIRNEMKTYDVRKPFRI